MEDPWVRRTRVTSAIRSSSASTAATGAARSSAARTSIDGACWRGSAGSWSSSARVTGRTSRWYPDAVTEVIAIEPEPRFRAQATEVARTTTVPIRVEPGTADDLPVEDGSVDSVVASLVLCPVPDQAAALAEVRHALKPGGELRFYEHVHAEPTAARLPRAGGSIAHL